jgi:signal transduction histidine kinase
MIEGERSVAPGVLRVLDVAAGVLSELDLDVVLQRLVESSRELTGARYAALGVLDRSGAEIERFITSGVDEVTRQLIGAFPRGRGVLGDLISNPAPVRLADVGTHPHAHGFPADHPEMRTFLGVPVFVGGQPFGNLYLTEKAAGEQFNEEDERALVRLAEIAGLAIDHARRYGRVRTQRAELQRTVQALDATLQIARAVSRETDLETILGLVAERGRALVSARAVVIEHEEHGQMLVAAAAGEVPGDLTGTTVDPRGNVASAALKMARTLRLEEEQNMALFERHGLGKAGLRAQAGLVVPLLFRGRGYGVLMAIDRQTDGAAFTAEDQSLLEAFAASAAGAIANARYLESERRNQRLAAAEQERARWARELHDETLQNLAALRMGIASQLRAGDPETLTEVLRDAVEQLQAEIDSLRALITDLRPTALDDLGTQAAIEDLAQRTRSHGLEVELSIDLGYEQGRQPHRHATELETALYRITQEALTNARKHGRATRAFVQIRDDQELVRVTIRDDGSGFDPTARTTGFGLHGMRDRAELLGGTLEINSQPGQGTEIIAVLPVLAGSTFMSAG